VNPEPAATPSQENQPAARALLDDVEVADRLNVSLQTVRNWRTRREGPRFVKLGKRAVRYRPEDVEAFIEGERQCA
jgi:excisionase family DNA binding protein